MKSVIITATGTDIGKTLTSAAVMAAHPDYRYWKPIQAGLDTPTDSDAVRSLGGCSPERILPERFRLKAALSPHQAARDENISIKLNDLRRHDSSSPLIIEGAGGLLVPINDEHLMIDAFKMWDLPVLLVCRSELGTINHSLLSCEALRARGIPILGVVCIGKRNDGNEQAIEHYGNVQVLGRLEASDRYTHESLLSEFRNQCGALSQLLSV